MKLYHIPQSRSVRVRWMLEELGVPYETVQLSMTDGSLKTPEHLARHPHGAVPVLEDDGVTLIESAVARLGWLTSRLVLGQRASFIMRPSTNTWFSPKPRSQP